MIGFKENASTQPEIIIDDPIIRSRQERRENLGIGPVSEIKKHTPNRKCLHQKVVGDRLFYLHVTKGWRSRKITGYVESIGGQADMTGFWDLIAKAQTERMAKEGAFA